MQQRTYNLADLFEQVAQAVPDRIAVICGAFQATYAELDRRATHLAVAMQARGVRSGDRVGLQLFNGPEYVEGFLAACKLGAMPVNINYRYVADELAYLYDNAGLKALLYAESLAPRVEPILERFPTLSVACRSGAQYEQLLKEAGASLQPVVRSSDDLMLLYTGGTTGQPKGVMWPHKALFFGALGGGGYFRAGQKPVTTAEELGEVAQACAPLRHLAVAPLMHGAALWAILSSLFAGQTVVMREQGEFDAVAIWDQVEQEKIHIIAIVGDAMGMPLLDALKQHPGRWDLSCLMALGSGGGLFSGHVQQGLREHLCSHTQVNDSMGSSEGGVLGSGSRPEKGDGLIRIAPRDDVRVVSTDLSRVLGPGETGLLARGGHVPVGYFGDPEKTAKTFFEMDGQRYVNMGDMARLEADGSIVVLGRDSQCINSGGEKVHVEEVEDVLHRHPAVLDAVVVGAADPRWGKVVSAVVSLRSGQTVSLEQLQAFCSQYLARYKVPRHLAVVEAVQRSPAGKADYRWADTVMERALSGLN